MDRESNLFIESKEKESARIFIEIGPGNRPILARLDNLGGDQMAYKAGNEVLFKIQPGDTLIELDLTPERNVHVFYQLMHTAKRSKDDPGKFDKSHLASTRDYYKKHESKNIKFEFVHADAKKLPFSDGQIDLIFMADVLNASIKDDELNGFKARNAQIVSEKKGIINEIYRVLKTGGRLIIEEKYRVVAGVENARDRVINELFLGAQFTVRDLTEIMQVDDMHEELKLLLECTKNQ